MKFNYYYYVAIIIITTTPLGLLLSDIYPNIIHHTNSLDYIFNLKSKNKNKNKSNNNGVFGTHWRNQQVNCTLINYIIRDDNLAYGGKGFNKAKSSSSVSKERANSNSCQTNKNKRIKQN